MKIVHGTDVFAELVNLSFYIAHYESPMNMNKKEFLLRQFAKTNKKNYENYVVTRVIHKLDDPTVKFITQQYVSRPERRRALTDLYIPQIAFHVEIDEGHHKNIVEVDMVREADIIDATGHTIVRVDATLPLDN